MIDHRRKQDEDGNPIPSYDGINIYGAGVSIRVSGIWDSAFTAS